MTESAVVSNKFKIILSLGFLVLIVTLLCTYIAFTNKSSPIETSLHNDSLNQRARVNINNSQLNNNVNRNTDINTNQTDSSESTWESAKEYLGFLWSYKWYVLLGATVSSVITVCLGKFFNKGPDPRGPDPK